MDISSSILRKNYIQPSFTLKVLSYNLNLRVPILAEIFELGLGQVERGNGRFRPAGHKPVRADFVLKVVALFVTNCYYKLNSLLLFITSHEGLNYRKETQHASTRQKDRTITRETERK